MSAGIISNPYLYGIVLSIVSSPFLPSSPSFLLSLSSSPPSSSPYSFPVPLSIPYQSVLREFGYSRITAGTEFNGYQSEPFYVGISPSLCSSCRIARALHFETNQYVAPGDVLSTRGKSRDPIARMTGTYPAVDRKDEDNLGIVSMECYFPKQFVSQSDLEQHDKVSSGKYTIGLGQDAMSFTTDREDICSISMTVLSNLLRKNGIDYGDVGWICVATGLCALSLFLSLSLRPFDDRNFLTLFLVLSDRVPPPQRRSWTIPSRSARC